MMPGRITGPMPERIIELLAGADGAPASVPFEGEGVEWWISAPSTIAAAG